jgi:ATP-dependent DNA ligase
MPLLPKIAPQLCRVAHQPPTGSGWLHEIKHDGHRILAAVEHGGVIGLGEAAMIVRCTVKRVGGF